MLVNTVGDFTAGGNRFGNIPTSCHVATLYWLYRDEFNRAPTEDQYLAAFGNPTAVVRSFLAHGRGLANPGARPFGAVAGSVLVFVRNGEPGHSCVKLAGTLIGGYNQLNWFTSAGADHRYSTHDVAHLRWRPGLLHGGQVRMNLPDVWGRLVAIPEATAKALVRAAVQNPPAH